MIQILFTGRNLLPLTLLPFAASLSASSELSRASCAFCRAFSSKSFRALSWEVMGFIIASASFRFFSAGLSWSLTCAKENVTKTQNATVTSAVVPNVLPASDPSLRHPLDMCCSAPCPLCLTGTSPLCQNWKAPHQRHPSHLELGSCEHGAGQIFTAQFSLEI